MMVLDEAERGYMLHDRVVRPAFVASGGVVYVLPERRAVQAFVGADGSAQRRF